MDFTCLIDLRCKLGEGPVWDDRRNRLFFVDILAPAIHCVALDGSDLKTWPMQKTAGSIGLTQSGKLVVALGLSVAVFDPDTGGLSPLVDLKAEPASNRTNDGKVGPDGAFWVGTMDNSPAPAVKAPVGHLYRVTADGKADPKVDGVIISNGLAWTPDGATMFHSDSRGPYIDRWAFDPKSGAISDKKRIKVLTPETEGRPDGAACDANGDYWSAGIFASRINHFDREGGLKAFYPVPVPTPTMPCFCGPDLKTVVVTSLRENFTPEQTAKSPMAGSLFIAQSPIAGAPVYRMRGL